MFDISPASLLYRAASEHLSSAPPAAATTSAAESSSSSAATLAPAAPTLNGDYEESGGATGDYDLAPIPLQKFIESATGSRSPDVDYTRILLDYAAAATALAPEAGVSDGGGGGGLYDVFGGVGGGGHSSDRPLLANLSYGLYGNDTLSGTAPPLSEADALANWTKTCADEYNPSLPQNHVEFWVCGVLLNIVGLLGILGNIISMIILSRPQMRSSINYLLIGLARCDIVLILTSMLLFGIPSVYPMTGYFFFYYNYVYPFISPAMYPIAMISQTASVYMTFTVTLERYVAVCHPLKARALCTYGRAKIYFIVCVAFAILYNMSRFWEVVMVSSPAPDGSIMLHCVRPSLLRRDLTYINVYIHWCYFIVNYGVPFLTLAILNCLIYRQVKRANRERQRLSRSEKREIGLATMLLCVVVVFFLLNVMALVLNIAEAFGIEVDASWTKVSNLLVTINSSVNFLIYVIFGEKFKRIFLLIFFKRRLSRDQPDLIHYESSISNNGDGTLNHRSSGRFSRHGTQRSMTTTATTTTMMNNVRLSQSHGSPGIVKIKRQRAPSPGPVVYYPAREMQRSAASMSSAMPALMSNNNTALGCDWTVDIKTGQMTSGF